MGRLLDICKCILAALVVASGFSSVYLAVPTDPGTGGISDALNLVGSLGLLVLFMVFAYRRQHGIHQVYYAMVAIAFVGVMGQMLGGYVGPLPTFGIGPLFIGLMLTSLSKTEAQRCTILGFGCAALVYPLFHACSSLPNAAIASLVSVVFYVAATVFMLLLGKNGREFDPAGQLLVVGLARGRRGLWGRPQVVFALFALVALAVYFVYFGMYETLVRRGDVGYLAADSNAVMFSLLSVMAVLFVLASKVAFERWVGITFLVAWSCFLVALVLGTVSTSFVGIAFTIENTVAAVLHIVAWLFILAFARDRSFSPLFLFGALTVVVKVAQMFGRLLGSVLVGYLGTGLHGVSTIAACFLAIVSLLCGILAAISIQTVRRSSADEESVSSSGAALVELGTGAWGETNAPSVRALCLTHGLSEREAEIVDLYCRGRSASVIGELTSLAEPTVRTYIRRAYDKLGVHSKQELFDLIRAE